MFDLGMQELIVIFIVALLVFGPKKLPELGRTIGKGIGELKRAMQNVKEQIDSEVDTSSLHKPFEDIKEDIKIDTKDLNEKIYGETSNQPSANRYPNTLVDKGKEQDD